MCPHFTVPDEELLLMFRMGNDNALVQLMERIFAMRRYSCSNVAPAASAQLNEWEQNEVVHHSFYRAVSYYEFRQTRFLTFYHTILKHELGRAAAHKLMVAPNGVVSLDQYVETESGGYMLHDLIPSTSPQDDPKAFLNYAESLLARSKLPKRVPAVAVTLVELLAKGCSVRVAGELLGLDENKARYMVRKFRLWAREVEGRVYANDPKRLKEEEKLLDGILQWKGDDEE